MPIRQGDDYLKAVKLKSGNWRVQVLVGHDSNGKRIMESFTAPTEWEALKMAADFKEGRITNRKHITVEQAINSYIESRKSVIAPATLHGYNVIAKSRLQSIRRVEIHKLDKLDIQRAVNADTENGLSWKSIKDALAVLRSACACYDVEIPPTSRFTLPARSPKKGELPDLSDVLDIVLGSSVELPCLLAIWCGGMRISEVRGLQYRDIITDKKGNHFISINRSRVFVDGRDNVKETNKTYGSTRKVPLPDYLYDVIQAKAHKEDTDFIVDESYLALIGRYNRLMKKHGIKITFHDLRALFATSMNELGVQKEILQKLGGWTNSKVLDSVYIRHSDEDLANSIDMLSQRIDPLIEQKAEDAKKKDESIPDTDSDKIK